MSRILPSLGLFLIAPLIAEFLLGDLPITAFAGLVIMAPLYGGGALLIREVCRRMDWGWPSMIVLALAYGIAEEGLVTQSLFNPGYAGKDLLALGYIPGIGIGASWTVFVLTLHMAWSISVPIASVELLVSPTRRRAPWLGRAGVGVTALLFVFGAVATTIMTHQQSGFFASAWQLLAALLLAALLIGLAAVVGHHHRLGGLRRWRTARVPSWWATALGSLAVTSAVTTLWYLGRDMAPGWLVAASIVALDALAIMVVAHWASLPNWAAEHQIALVAGALLTYGWEGFVTSHMLVQASPRIQLVSHIVFACAALVLICALAAGSAASTSAGCAAQPQRCRSPNPNRRGP